MSTNPKNVFSDLYGSFSAGTEDFFTASLVTMLRRHVELREGFSAWVDEAGGGTNLREGNWEITAQAQRVARKDFGNAIIDMVFASADTQVWFEHKVDAPLG